MYGFHFTTFIEYMIAGKPYTNLFSPNDYQKNDKLIRKYFKEKYGKEVLFRTNKTWFID